MTENSGHAGTPLPKTSNPAQAALAIAGIHTLEDLTKITEEELLALHGVGPKAVRILRAEMVARSLAFAAPTSRKAP